MSTNSDAKRPEAILLPLQPLDRTIRAVTAASLLAAGLIGSSAQAQQKPAADDQLQEIIVTGSLIKRTDVETPSPIQVITADDLKNSGYTNVSDVLRNLSSNGASALSQSFNGAFGAGGSGISLRGLTVGDTLVLIDGVRQVTYPLDDDNQRGFVDVSAIPINAVERIEIVKDNASAEYGADAIAGVVNIILKKNYKGVEFTAEAGTSQLGGGTTEHLAAIYGWGDLDTDGYNMYVAVDYHHQDTILDSQRAGEGFATLDWTALPSGINNTPGAPNSPIFTYPDSTTGYIINPTALANQTSGPTAQTYLPGCSYTQSQAGQCEFNYPLQIQPPSQQTNVISKLSKKLSDDWTLTVTGSFFDSITDQVSTYLGASNPVGGFTWYAFSASSPLALVNTPPLTVPANYPGNPYGTAAPLIYNFPAAPNDQIESETYRLVGDVTGKVGGWDLDGSVAIMYAKSQETISGYIQENLLQNALNNGTYVIGQTSIATGESIFAQPYSASPSSTLDVVDAHATRELLELPGGPLAVAVGAEYLHRAVNATSPPLVASGQYYGAQPLFDVGSQDDTAGYLQFEGHPIKELEVEAAVRYDHYDTAGGAATPKFGVKYQPITWLALRGTWGKGFRAPSTAEGAASGEVFGAGNYTDPVLCKNGPNTAGSFNSQCSFGVTGYQTAGSNLKPVTSTNETFGVIFEPSKDFNVSADFYQIKLTNDIISAFEAGGLGNYTAIGRGPQQELAECVNTTTNGTACTTVNALTPVGTIAFLQYPYVNAGETLTDGFDIDMRGAYDTGNFGKLSAELNYTHIISYKETVGGNTYQLAGTHGPSGVSGDTGNPRDRATASITWSRGPASGTVSENWVGQFSVIDPSAGIDDCLTALSDGYNSIGVVRFVGLTQAQVPVAYCNVHSFFETNLYGQYSVIEDRLVVHGSITNLFNSQPPLDLQTYGGGGNLAYDGAFHQDGAVGRFFMAGFTVKF
jgi:iron complex outermembrane receptor protein